MEVWKLNKKNQKNDNANATHKSQFLTVHVTLYVVYRQVIGVFGHHKLLTFLYWKKIFEIYHGPRLIGFLTAA